MIYRNKMFHIKTLSLKLAIIIFHFFFVSCKEMEPDFILENNIDITIPSEIKFYVDGMVSTKVDDLTSLQSFYVRCVRGNIGMTSEKSVFSTRFRYSSGGYFTGNKYWPAKDLQYTFYASNNNLTSSSSGTYVIATNTTDVVVAISKYSSSNYKEIINLTFNHVFAKIGYCKVVPPSGYTVTNVTVKVKPLITGRYYPYNGTWTNMLSGTDITLTTTVNSTVINDYYLIPGTYTVSLQYTISQGDYSESKTTTLPLNFVAGKRSNIVLNLPKINENTAPGGGVVIDPWEGGGDIGEGM